MITHLLRIVGVLVLLVTTGAGRAADLKVLSTPTVRAVLQDVLPKFQQDTGQSVEVVYDPVGALKRRIEAGESFDLSILVPNVADALMREGALDGASRVNFARAGYGVAVKAGGPAPDVATVDGLKQALLQAQGLAYSPDSNSSAYFLSLIDKLGLAEQLRPRLRAVAGPHVVEAVGRGDADLTIITVPNIVGERGVQLAGALPPELQNYSVFVITASARTAHRDAAVALSKYLQSDAVTAAIRARGLERVP